MFRPSTKTFSDTVTVQPHRVEGNLSESDDQGKSVSVQWYNEVFHMFSIAIIASVSGLSKGMELRGECLWFSVKTEFQA